VVLARELGRGFQRLHVVFVGADHEHAVDADLVRVEALDRALDLGEVLLLLEELQRARIDRLEADVHVEAVGVAHELQQLGVVDRSELCTRAPSALRYVRFWIRSNPSPRWIASTSSWNANSPSPRTMKSACSMPSSARKLVCVPPITAIAPASRTLSASRYDCGAVEVMAEIATRSAESTSLMSRSW